MTIKIVFLIISTVVMLGLVGSFFVFFRSVLETLRGSSRRLQTILLLPTVAAWFVAGVTTAKVILEWSSYNILNRVFEVQLVIVAVFFASMITWLACVVRPSRS